MSQMLPRSRWSKLGEAALWSGACATVLAAHLAAASVMLREEPEDTAEASQPAAIMIELAPEPEATQTDETLVAEDQQDSEEVKSDTTQPVDEPLPEPVVEPAPEPPPEPPQEVAETPEPPPEPVMEEPKPEEPVKEVTETIPEKPPEPIEETVDQPAEQQLALLQNVEVPLPVVRPPEVEEQKPEITEEKPKPVEKKVVRAEKPRPKPPASKAAQQAKAEVQQSDRTAAAATSTSLGGSSLSPARWQTKLAAHLGRQRGRCPATGRGSTAYVTFRIDDGGNLSAVSLARSSGYSDFDNYMVELVRRASPVPPPPAGIGNKVTVPLGYKNC
ncbi:energy transducer TonB [Rhizobium sp. SGZ-381]|uniref:energy transducer TonB family protein n=1 Tax=Rhizobium sp. SGZ-381 TaxID=3342800 RepID=UPI0036714F76